MSDGDGKRDRDRKMRACVQEETDEWESEMHLKDEASNLARTQLNEALASE